MNKVKKLQENLIDLKNSIKAFSVKHQDSSSELSDEQKQEWDNLIKEEVRILQDIVIAEAQEKRDQEMAKRAGEVLDGNGVPKFSKGDVRDISRFKLTQGIKDIKQNSGNLQGIEAEMNQEATKEAAAAGITLEGNFHIPEQLFAIGERDFGQKQRDLTIATEGGDVRPVEHGALIPILRADPVVVRLGASVLSGLSGNLLFPRVSGGSSFAWEGEGDAGAETTQTFDNITLSPKRVGGYTDMSQQFMFQASFAAESWLKRELEAGLAVEIDSKAIDGTGANDQPTGLITAAIGNADIGTNGGALTYSACLNVLQDVASADAMKGKLGWITTPGVLYQELARVLKSSADTASNFIYTPGAGAPFLGFPIEISTQVPSDIAKGSGSNLNALIFGNWEELLIGSWGGASLLVDPYTQAASGLIRILINSYLDVGFKHLGSFSAIEDISIA